MRKNQKQQLCEMLDTLKEAHSELPHQSDADISAILADCQECAIVIGNTVEAAQGDGHPAVSLLVQYCEMLYRLNVAVAERVEWKVLNGETKSFLNRIRLSITEDIPVTVEIVFLPYKAAMWDSMESIWQAAQTDPECTCHVIPIPYFEKNGEGKGAEMIYEGSRFPSYVPITDYQAYNLAENHPDIIYFHNPFDQYNYVTSIHPSYYSNELKKCTDMLVYVPYFISAGGMPEAQLGASGYRFADCIILQNQAMYEDMVKEVPQEKLVVLGSPKIDRMLRLEKEKPSMPPEWAGFIRGRKVIFYNTSITDFLADSEKALNKMEGVFQTFQKNKDMALLWRPHPLMRATLQSMRAGLTERYDKLERWFLKEKIGILDKTPDVNASVALSDAYIGDACSSVVHLFGITGKPIFVLNNNEVYPHVTMEERASADFGFYAQDGDDIWFIAYGYHAICRLDLLTGGLEVIATIPETGWDKPTEYIDIFKFGDKIIFYSRRAIFLCEYNLKKGNFRKIYFKALEGMEEIAVSRGFQYKKFLYLVPFEYAPIICYDTEYENFAYYDGWITDMQKAIGEIAVWERPLGWGPEIYEDCLYLPSAVSNHILIFYLETAEYSVRKVGKEENIYVWSVFGEKYIWLYTDSHMVIRCDAELNQTSSYVLPDLKVDKFPYVNGYEFQGEFYALARRKKESYRFDTDGITVERISDILPYYEGQYVSDYYRQPDPYHWFLPIDKTRFGGFMTYDNSFLVLNPMDGSHTSYPLRLPENYVVERIARWIGHKYGWTSKFPYICNESYSVSLEMFLIYLCSSHHNRREQLRHYTELAENMDGTSGIKIHEYIKKREGC